MTHDTLTNDTLANDAATVAPAEATTGAGAGTTQQSRSRRARAEEAGRDLALLLTRIGLAILMLWHVKLAWDYTGGVAGMVAGFEQAGIPLPELTARVNLFGELIGGILLILGAGVRSIGAFMAVNMAGAWYYVHTSGLYAMDHNGPELSIALGLLSLMLVVTGSGRLGLDHLRRS